MLHKFEDSYFFIPEKIDDYLTTLYGCDYMKLPPENKRRKGFNIYLLTED
jgi:phosphorylcholine metabolism protein LicD